MKKILLFILLINAIIASPCNTAPAPQEPVGFSSPVKSPFKRHAETPLSPPAEALAALAQYNSPEQKKRKKRKKKKTQEDRDEKENNDEQNFLLSPPQRTRNILLTPEQRRQVQLTLMRDDEHRINVPVALRMQLEDNISNFIAVSDYVTKKQLPQLLKEIEQRREQGEILLSPSKNAIDHAVVTDDVLSSALLRGTPYSFVDGNGNKHLEVVCEANARYEGIRNTRELNDDGFIVLTFGYDQTNKKESKKHPYILYHACFQNKTNSIVPSDGQSKEKIHATAFIDKTNGRLKFKLKKLKKPKKSKVEDEDVDVA